MYEQAGEDGDEGYGLDGPFEARRCHVGEDIKQNHGECADLERVLRDDGKHGRTFREREMRRVCGVYVYLVRGRGVKAPQGVMPFAARWLRHTQCVPSLGSMLFLIGAVFVISCVLTGYVMHHGDLAVLWQPTEFIIIIGAAIGGFIIANPMHVIKGTGGAMKYVIAGHPLAKKTAYMELVGFFFELSKLMRTKGIKEVETHIDHPHDSALFQKYPSLMKDHHLEQFICDNVRLIVMGSGNPHQLDELMDEEMHVHHTERHAQMGSIQAMGDAMPALGIVAAVLGVIVTMGSIDQPPAILGKLIGAALVGTFLGVLVAYGYLNPLAKNLEAIFAAEHNYYACTKVAILNFARQLSPQLIAEFTRKSMPGNVKPSFQEMEEYLNGIAK